VFTRTYAPNAVLIPARGAAMNRPMHRKMGGTSVIAVPETSDTARQGSRKVRNAARRK
jgi:hypothetical protein